MFFAAEMANLVIGAVLLCAAGASAKGKKDPRDTDLAALANAVGCPSDSAPQRVWCLATDGWAQDKASKLLGLTIELEDGKAIADKGKVKAHLTNVTSGRRRVDRDRDPGRQERHLGHHLHRPDHFWIVTSASVSVARNAERSARSASRN
jgi:hypothetical protein